jgi:hypothetical protein
MKTRDKARAARPDAGRPGEAIYGAAELYDRLAVD